MALKNTNDAWGGVAKFLHWLVVLLVIAQFVLASMADDLAPGLQKLALLARHKSFGVTIFAIALVRVVWRFANPTPELPATMKGYERLLARGTHLLLYLVLLVMPLSGWLMSSAKGYSVSWFGLVQLPDLVGRDDGVFDAMHELHESLAYALVAIATLHLLAALKHHFVNRDNILRRMLPFVRPGS
ncbi:MAG: cytochrome b [Steroidobacteraceae bacterium]